MGKSPLVMLVIAVTLLLARSGNAQPPPPVDAYCCLCADCAGAGCVLVDVVEKTIGLSNVGEPCPGFCPMDCHGSVLVDGACAEHTTAECPVTERAPVLSPWAAALCIAALGAYGLRRVWRS